MKLTLNGLKRIGMKTHPKWWRRTVYIWSAEHGANWREGGAGYTCKNSEAGRWEFLEAIRTTKHCGREKRIEYIAIPKAALKTALGGEK